MLNNKITLNKYRNKIQIRENFVPENGKSIQEIKKNILKLQQELAVSLRERDNKTSNKIINKIIRNKDCRILAVYKTISTKGYRSKGFRDEKPTTNVQYSKLVSLLWEAIKKPNSYKSTPLKRTMLPKPKGGFRPISVPTYFDRSLQHLYKLVLEVIAEEIQSPFSFGFRPFRSPAWATKRLVLATFPFITPPKYGLELDIAKCFDTMDHNWMLNNVTKIKIDENCEVDVIPRHILNQWLKSGFIYTDDIAKKSIKILPTTGIPQGGPISPTIANIVLNGIENVILKVGEDFNDKVYPSRFADDITLIFNDINIYNNILESVDSFLETRGMKLNREKCFLRNLSKNERINFVGFTHLITRKRRPEIMNKRTTKKNFTHIVLPMENKILSLKTKISKILNNRNKSSFSIFQEANSVLRGWLNFYSSANSAITFKGLSWWLWHKTFHYFWIKYRSQDQFRNKSSTLRKKLGEYIVKTHTKIHGRSIRNAIIRRRNQWWYIPKNLNPKKNPQELFLICPELIPISQPPIILFRPKTREGLNAFHPIDRIDLQSKSLGWQTGTWKQALIKTKGNCACCSTTLVSLTEDEIIELHHVNPIQFGGPRTIPNILPLCKECHKDVTIAVSSRNVEKIIQYENMKILKDVSTSLNLLPKALSE